MSIQATEHRLRRVENDVESIYDELTAISTKLVDHDGRFDRIDARLETLTQQMGAVLERLDAR